MKNNEYLQKYGEKALQLYKKTQRTHQQPQQMQENLVSKKRSKNKSNSQKSLKYDRSKDKINGSIHEPIFKIQRINPIKNKNKLLISGASTPKNKFSKNKNQDDLKRSPSTKKKQNSEHILSRLQQIIKNQKKQTKKMVSGAFECIELISQQQQQVKQWLMYLKDIIGLLADEVSKFKTKWRSQRAKNIRLQKQIEEMSQAIKLDKKKLNQTTEYILLGENQKLKEKIQKMNHKLKDYQRKQMVLISTLEQYNIKRNQKTELYPEVGIEFNQEQDSDQYNSSEEQSINVN